MRTYPSTNEASEQRVRPRLAKTYESKVTDERAAPGRNTIYLATSLKNETESVIQVNGDSHIANNVFTIRSQARNETSVTAATRVHRLVSHGARAASIPADFCETHWSARPSQAGPGAERSFRRARRSRFAAKPSVERGDLTQCCGRPLRAAAWLLVALVMTVLGAGCPGPGDRAPAKSCGKAYEKCVLANGVLGVCDTIVCAPDATPPCLVCRSQH
jgi:hypothetical protein